MPYPHWEYFLAIESDLLTTARFIEFAQDNFRVYSIELVRILLSSASEIDVIAKEICDNLDPSASHANFDDYRKTIMTKYPIFTRSKILIPRYGLEFYPWKSWETDKNPNWWRSYNDVKHHRNEYFNKANLENTLCTVAGLFSLVLFLYRSANSANELIPIPQLFMSYDYHIPPNPSNLTLESFLRL